MNGELTTKDGIKVYNGKAILVWVYPEKSKGMFVVKCREADQTKWLVEQLLKQVA